MHKDVIELKRRMEAEKKWGEFKGLPWCFVHGCSFAGVCPVCYADNDVKEEIRMILHKLEITSYEIGYMEKLNEKRLSRTRADFVLKVFNAMAEISKLVKE